MGRNHATVTMVQPLRGGVGCCEKHSREMRRNVAIVPPSTTTTSVAGAGAVPSTCACVLYADGRTILTLSRGGGFRSSCRKGNDAVISGAWCVV